MAQAIALAADAFTDYVAGLRANAQRGIALSEDEAALAVLDKGDVRLNRAGGQFESVGRRIIELDEEYSIP